MSTCARLRRQRCGRTQPYSSVQLPEHVDGFHLGLQPGARDATRTDLLAEHREERRLRADLHLDARLEVAA